MTPTVSPKPLGSLLASAQRITGGKVPRRIVGGADWQEDAWTMFDLIGEHRFLATTLAERMAQARFFVGKVNEDATAPTDPLEDGDPVNLVLESFGNTPVSRAQLISRLGVNLFVAGDGWFCGIPPHLLNPDVEESADSSLTDFEWYMLSVDEVTSRGSFEVSIKLSEDRIVTAHVDDVFLIRVWRSHPRHAWQADSPTRSSLPVLRELVGLTMHIGAQVDSRLAGAGLLIVPESAKRAFKIAAGLPEDDDSDPFTEALMQAMLTPIGDRSNASAVVPLVVTVPDEAADKFQHIKFSTALDAEARNLRDEAIRRLALGLDAPPELLLGVSSMNHWGAWLVREDVVTTHLEPPLALICDALTTQFLWPVLMDQGMTEEEAQTYVIWYDVSHMIARPNRLQDAFVLHERKVITDDALRTAADFTDEEAPAALSPAVTLALQMATADPNLIVEPGLPVIIAALEDAIGGAPIATDSTDEPDTDVPQTGPPLTEPALASLSPGEWTPETREVFMAATGGYIENRNR